MEEPSVIGDIQASLMASLSKDRIVDHQEPSTAYGRNMVILLYDCCCDK